MGKKTTMLVGSLVVWLAGAGAHAAPPYEEAARNLPAALDLVSLNPGQLQQVDEGFKVKAGQSNLESGWAKVVVNLGSGVVAYASVLDNTATNNQKPSDPTTIPFKR
jgi:hypothetical protein